MALFQKKTKILCRETLFFGEPIQWATETDHHWHLRLGLFWQKHYQREIKNKELFYKENGRQHYDFTDDRRSWSDRLEDERFYKKLVKEKFPHVDLSPYETEPWETQYQLAGQQVYDAQLHSASFPERAIFVVKHGLIDCLESLFTKVNDVNEFLQYRDLKNHTILSHVDRYKPWFCKFITQLLYVLPDNTTRVALLINGYSEYQTVLDIACHSKITGDMIKLALSYFPDDNARIEMLNNHCDPILYEAVHKQNWSCVDQAISSLSSSEARYKVINVKSKYGDAPIYEAASRAETGGFVKEALRCFPSDAARIRVLTDRSRFGLANCLHRAANGNQDFLCHVLCSLSNDNARIGVLMIKNESGKTVLHCATANERNGDLIANVLATLSHNASRVALLSAKDDEGNTFFHEAIDLQHDDVIWCALSCFQDDRARVIVLTERNYKGNTVLHEAGHVGKDVIIKRALLYFPYEASRFDALTAKNELGNTVLHAAASGDFWDCTEQVLLALPHDMARAGAIAIHNNDGDTVFHLAARKGKWGFIQKMLVYFPHDRARADILTAKNIKGTHVLFEVSFRENLNFLQQALMYFSDDTERSAVLADKDIENDEQTILHMIVFLGDGDFIKYLLSFFPEDLEAAAALSAKDNEGNTVVHMAGYSCNSDCLKRILSNFPDDLARVNAITITNDAGQTTLHIAAYKGNGDFIKEAMVYFCDAEPRVGALNIKDNDGDTILHVAAYQSHWQLIFQVLMCYPNDANRLIALTEKNDQSYTILHVAIQKRNYDFIPQALLLLNNSLRTSKMHLKRLQVTLESCLKSEIKKTRTISKLHQSFSPLLNENDPVRLWFRYKSTGLLMDTVYWYRIVMSLKQKILDWSKIPQWLNGLNDDEKAKCIAFLKVEVVPPLRLQNEALFFKQDIGAIEGAAVALVETLEARTSVQN